MAKASGARTVVERSDRIAPLRTTGRWRDAVRRERAVLAVTLPFILLTFTVGPFVGWHRPVGVLFWFARTAMGAVVVITGLVVMTRMRRELRSLPASPGYARAWRILRESSLHNDRLVPFAIISIVLPVMAACFTGWKVWLNAELPFSWDASLARWDVVIHGGRPPSDYLHPLVEIPAVFGAMEWFYDIGWAAFLHAVITWQALRAQSVDRTRFLVAFALAWPVAGLVVAGSLMSAGPCYYEHVVSGPNPYERFMATLTTNSRLAVPLQDDLWNLYASRNVSTPGGGISAMPSLHVLTTAIAAIALWRHGRAWRIASITIVTLVLLGSVLLGWHYAVDGYVAVLIAFALWWSAGVVARRLGTSGGTPTRVTPAEPAAGWPR